jgi:hypothetical protein
MGFYYCIDTFKLRINLQIIWRINPTTMSDTGILQTCQTLKSYHHVRHWNSTNMWDTEILPPCQTLKSYHHVRHCCCEIPVSHIAVKFQCLELLCNSSVSCGCEVPVFHAVATNMSDTEILPPCQTLEFYKHVRHWNPTTMSDTGILQPCQTLKSYHHVRHWNSTNMSDTVGFQCLTCL